MTKIIGKLLKRGKVSIYTIPETIDEAFQVLDLYLTKEDKEWMKEEKNSAIKVHHTLGRWMRNQWKFWEGNTKLTNYLTSQGFIHPDDMSNEILEKYVEYLKNK